MRTRASSRVKRHLIRDSVHGFADSPVALFRHPLRGSFIFGTFTTGSAYSPVASPAIPFPN